jgi:hypothetical protein
VSSDEQARPELALDVVADLTLTVGDADVHIDGYGDLVVVDAPNLRTALTLLRGADHLHPAFVERGLARSDVVVDVRVRGGSIARLGPGIRPGPVSRTLGVEPARVSLGSAVLAALGR